MLKTFPPGNSLVVQGLRLSTFTATGPGFTLDWGNKIPQDVQPKKKKKKNPLLTTKSLLTTGHCGSTSLGCSRRAGSLPEARAL